MISAGSDKGSIASKISFDIEKYGWHIVRMRHNLNRPAFAYSIGFTEKFSHPEVFIVGVELSRCETVLNRIGQLIRSGLRFESGHLYDTILDGNTCAMLNIPVSYFDHYFGQALGYYHFKPRFLQCVYPDLNGLFPWDSHSSDEQRMAQPILGTWLEHP